MKRRKLIAGNWKMNLDKDSAEKLAKDIYEMLYNRHIEEDILLIPSTLHVERVVDKQMVKGKKVYSVGAQDVSRYEHGAFTGDNSADMLSKSGVEYVLIGHSERREYYSENSTKLKDKLKLCYKYNLKPVFCCGETLPVREEGKHKDHVWRQLRQTLKAFTIDQIRNTVIAYEPVWAIGTGKTATNDQVQEMHNAIRWWIGKHTDKQTADSIRILYGGSCKPDNAKALFNCPDVDGGLIGGASLKAADFLAIIEAAQ